MADLISTVRYWLVLHPSIAQYEWRQNHTIGSSPLFPALTITTYLTLTLTLNHYAAAAPPLSAATLRRITATHNLVLCLLSLAMSLGTSLSAAQHGWRWAVCIPGEIVTRGPVFFWAHVFYFSKILEFLDTWLIILGGNESRARRLSFLHVYHHSVVVVMCFLWLYTAQSLFPIALVTNASVHVLMYCYYLLCALGHRPKWKRLVTDCQIIQFVFSFLVSVVMLYYHFFGSGCSGIWGWCFNAVFNASLLYLFFDFHSKNYRAKKMVEDHDKNKQS